MLEVKDLKIYISRGDTASVTVQFEGEDVPDNTVVALIVLQKTADSSETIWEKRIPINDAQVVIPFRKNDTIDLPHGEYRWILRLIYEDGSVYTPMNGYEKFVVYPAGGDISGDGGGDDPEESGGGEAQDTDGGDGGE